MAQKEFHEIKKMLASEDPKDIHQGLLGVREVLPETDAENARVLFEMISPLFYIDVLDHPELVPVLDEAVGLMADFGEQAIPILLETLDAGDMKAQLTIGHAFGRIGEEAIEPLLESYKCEESPECRIFLAYALGKIRSPKVIEAFKPLLEAASSEHTELRDTAVRALGEFVEVIPPEDLPEEYKQAMLDEIQDNLAHPSAGVRSKAIRSYGKLARFGHLTAGEKEKCRETCELLLGVDKSFDWDRAYIVRKEAQEALDCLEGCD